MSSSFTLPSESIKRRTRLAKGPFEMGLRLGSTFENELAVLTGYNLKEETFKHGTMLIISLTVNVQITIPRATGSRLSDHPTC